MDNKHALLRSWPCFLLFGRAKVLQRRVRFEVRPRLKKDKNKKINFILRRFATLVCILHAKSCSRSFLCKYYSIITRTRRKKSGALKIRSNISIAKVSVAFYCSLQQSFYKFTFLSALRFEDTRKGREFDSYSV